MWVILQPVLRLSLIWAIVVVCGWVHAVLYVIFCVCVGKVKAIGVIAGEKKRERESNSETEVESLCSPGPSVLLGNRRHAWLSDTCLSREGLPGNLLLDHWIHRPRYLNANQFYTSASHPSLSPAPHVLCIPASCKPIPRNVCACKLPHCAVLYNGCHRL